MTPAALIGFVVCFVVGPALCAGLMRLPATLPSLIGLALAILAATMAALRLQSGGAALVSLGLMWLAWVLAVSMAALALNRRATDARLRRWITIGALLATTLPWFGLATADLMV